MDSNITITKCNSKNINSYKVKLLQSFTYHSDTNRASRERGLLEETIKFVQKKKTLIYILKQNDIFLGLVSLSASSIDDAPVIQIDYLFVDFNYRKLFIKELDNTIAKYFIVFSMDIAKNIQESIGLKYLALYPDGQSKNLINHYKNMGFNVLNKEWLFIKLD
ncbi:MAG: hypothetical protein DRG78_16265 [Epsilonproteobacteria bacterium]|nr:MAG: hypothetical protein DRG78_16265 [Campylobacterota bacterium]